MNDILQAKAVLACEYLRHLSTLRIETCLENLGYGETICTKGHFSIVLKCARYDTIFTYWYSPKSVEIFRDGKWVNALRVLYEEELARKRLEKLNRWKPLEED
jgi:hypothetical protein